MYDLYSLIETAMPFPLSEQQKLILREIAENKENHPLSSYKIADNIRNNERIPRDHKTAENNVSKILKRFENQKIVKRMEYVGMHSNAKCYALTDLGIQTMFANQLLDIDVGLLFRNYPESVFHAAFIQPYFSEETMDRLTPTLRIIMATYVHQVVSFAFDAMIKIRSEKIEHPRSFFSDSVLQFTGLMLLTVVVDARKNKEDLAVVRKDKKFKMTTFALTKKIVEICQDVLR